MKKTFLSLIAFLLLTASVLSFASCGNKPGSKAETTENSWKMSDETDDAKNWSKRY